MTSPPPGRPPKRPRPPLGPPVQVTAEDLAHARATWRRLASARFRSMLDAGLSPGR